MRDTKTTAPEQKSCAPESHLGSTACSATQPHAYARACAPRRDRPSGVPGNPELTHPYPDLPKETWSMKDMIHHLYDALVAGLRTQNPTRIQEETSIVLARCSEALPQLSDQARRWECRGAACNFCCFMTPPGIGPLEAHLIVSQLAQLPPEAHGAVREGVAVSDRHWGAIRYPVPRMAPSPCALLAADGRCGVYTIRPVMCRGFVSFSRDSCETAARQDFTSPIAMDTRALHAASWFLHLQRAACEAVGLVWGTYELPSILHVLLTHPEAFADWVGGRDAFAECRVSVAGVAVSAAVYQDVMDQAFHRFRQDFAL
jgi:Fe-S-cluster containining protein